MDVSDADGDTALIIAARCNHLETVKLLLKRKADPRVQNELGCTALHAAARNGHLEVARLFIGNGNVLNVCDNAGHTALHDSVWNCHDSVARLLVEAGASTSPPIRRATPAYRRSSSATPRSPACWSYCVRRASPRPVG